MLKEKNILIVLAFFAFAFSLATVFSAANVYADYTINCGSNCTTNYCSCSSTCTSGYFNIYSSSNCSGIASNKIIISNSSFNFVPPSTLMYGKILCTGGNISACYLINLTFATPTTTTTTIVPTTTTTTTTPALLPCPNQCCSNLPGYQTVTCPNGQTCAADMTCKPIKTDCLSECCVNDQNYNDKLCSSSDATCISGKCVTPGPQISYSLVLIIAIIVIVAVVAFYFIRDKVAGKKGASNKDAYETLKGKWSSR